MLCGSSIKLTICSTSVETICIQHMAVARAHTMVEMTFSAHTLKSSSWRRQTEEGGGREAVRGKKKHKAAGEKKERQDVVMHVSRRVI